VTARKEPKCQYVRVTRSHQEERRNRCTQHNVYYCLDRLDHVFACGQVLASMFSVIPARLGPNQSPPETPSSILMRSVTVCDGLDAERARGYVSG